MSSFQFLNFEFAVFKFQLSIIKIRCFKSKLQNGDVQISIPTTNTCIYSHKLCLVGSQNPVFASWCSCEPLRSCPAVRGYTYCGALSPQCCCQFISLLLMLFVIVLIYHFNIILIFFIITMIITRTNHCYYYHITIRSMIIIEFILKIILNIILSTSLWDLAPN